MRPAAATFALLGVALAGVALVISGGHPVLDRRTARSAGATCSSSPGVFSFVLYGLGAAEFSDVLAAPLHGADGRRSGG